jgi:hypothetical protein
MLSALSLSSYDTVCIRKYCYDRQKTICTTYSQHHFTAPWKFNHKNLDATSSGCSILLHPLELRKIFSEKERRGEQTCMLCSTNEFYLFPFTKWRHCVSVHFQKKMICCGACWNMHVRSNRGFPVNGAIIITVLQCFVARPSLVFATMLRSSSRLTQMSSREVHSASNRAIFSLHNVGYEGPIYVGHCASSAKDMFLVSSQFHMLPIRESHMRHCRTSLCRGFLKKNSRSNVDHTMWRS